MTLLRSHITAVGGRQGGDRTEEKASAWPEESALS